LGYVNPLHGLSYTSIERSLKVKLLKEGPEVGRVREDDQRREGRTKNIKACAKVEKSPNTVFFQCFGAPEGQKAGLLMRAIWEAEK
jgi:hypothetical protein